MYMASQGSSRPLKTHDFNYSHATMLSRSLTAWFRRVSVSVCPCLSVSAFLVWALVECETAYLLAWALPEPLVFYLFWVCEVHANILRRIVSNSHFSKRPGAQEMTIVWCHVGPNIPNTGYLEVFAGICKYMKVLWKYMSVYAGKCKYMGVYGCICGYMGVHGVYEFIWKYMKVYGGIWRCIRIWRYMKVYGGMCGYMEVWEAVGLGRIPGRGDWTAAAKGELMPSELYHPRRYENKLNFLCSTEWK